MENAQKLFEAINIKGATRRMSPRIKARQNAALDKRYMFSSGESSYREQIDAGVYCRAEAAEVARVQYDRRKFNRMTGAQQEAYKKRVAETKTEYRLYYADDSDAYSRIPKLVYAYAKEVLP